MKLFERVIVGKNLFGVLMWSISSCLLMTPMSIFAQSVQSPVNLGAASDYIILSQAGSAPIPGTLTGAINDMNIAYANAASRQAPDFIDVGAGNITGLTLVPGLYRWNADVLVNATGVTLSGGPNAVWVFQIAGDLTLSSGANLFLEGGARASNIFWQVGGSSVGATLGAGSVMHGTILSARQIIGNAGAILVGRALAKAQVTLQSGSVAAPVTLAVAIPDPSRPTVSSTVPSDGVSNVPVGVVPSATFQEAMNSSTINAGTFILRQGIASIAGTVNYSGQTATFTPTASLTPNTQFTATITAGAQDVAGSALLREYMWTFTTGAPPDSIPPTVTSVIPHNASTAVPTGEALSATFSTAMNPLTISPATFTLKQGANAVAGTVSYAGITATFTPSASLAPNLPFTATITTGAKDLADRALVRDYVWSFVTGAGRGVSQAKIVSTFPAAGLTGTSISLSLKATFSEAMDPLTVSTSTFTLSRSGSPVAGTVNYSGLTANFTPLSYLAPDAIYTATITTGVTDVPGNYLAANYTWNFSTASVVVPVVHLTVTSTTPANTASPVTLSTNVVAKFNEAVYARTVNAETFTLQQGTTPVPGTVTSVDNSATFRPAANLLANTVYTARIAGSVADLANNAMGSDYVWSFTTGTPGNQLAICLANFALLAAVSIDSGGTSAITGDIGVTPGTSIIGFPAGTMNGAAYTGDNANVSQAMIDVTSAFADAAGRAGGPAPLDGDLGGQTLTAGLYRSSGPLVIQGGDLSLDAKGDANAVFIFQVATTLTVGANRRVILSGGAQAFNVFWQVGTSAALGADTDFSGSILAYQSIALDTGATLSGRLAALTGSISLQSNVVTSPSPSIASGAVLNAASYTTAVAPGSIVSVFGSNFSSSTESAQAYPLPPSLGQTSFQVGSQSGPLFMTSCRQTNLQIPWESAGRTEVPVTATVEGVVSAPQSAAIAPFAPGIFTLDQSGSGQGMVAIAATGQLAGPQGPGASPVARGQYVAIYGTGLGEVSNQPATGEAASSSPLSYTSILPTVTIGGVGAPVTYSGLAPGFAGLYQVNALVPSSVGAGNAVSLVMEMGSVRSNTVTIAVQ